MEKFHAKKKKGAHKVYIAVSLLQMMKGELMILLGLMGIGVLLLSSFAVAEEGSSEVATAAAQALVCKAEFTAQAVSSTLTAMPNATELNVHVEKLNADVTQLKTLASAGNASEVRAFLKGTYEP